MVVLSRRGRSGSVRERNVRAVHALYDAERRRDIHAWEALWSASGEHVFWLAEPTPPVVGRDELVRVTAAKFADRPPYEIEVATDPLADESKVLARLRLSASALPGRGVHLWCLFHFDRDGLISSIEEIVDTNPGAAEWSTS